MLTRREILEASLVLPLTASTLRAGQSQPRVAVIGAGAFGGWTALDLQRRGARVTLIDAWGPGHTRASSGGETRVIRLTYGDRAIYTRLSARALQLWRAHERQWQKKFLTTSGAIWMFGGDDSFGKASMTTLAAQGHTAEMLSPADAAKRWPQVNFDGITRVLFEPEAGALLARRSCEAVVEAFSAAGGTYRAAAVAGPVSLTSRATAIPLTDGSRLDADVFVFACGPWLGALFPDVVGTRVTPTRQEVHYFGTAAGDTRFDEGRLPVWIDYGKELIYGIPGNANRGFKLANDAPGPVFDPTAGSREPSRDSIEAARAFITRRFPALAQAPYLGSEVCQYEASPDSHFIVDTHPAAPNVWIVGGGSGHGFKMGPALGELVAAQVLGQQPKEATFRLGRLS